MCPLKMTFACRSGILVGSSLISPALIAFLIRRDCLRRLSLGLHMLVLGFGGDAIRVRGKCDPLQICAGRKAVAPGDEGGEKKGDDHPVESVDEKKSDAKMTTLIGAVQKRRTKVATANA